MTQKYSPKSSLKVSGKMSTEDAGAVSAMLAKAAMVLARYAGLAALIIALGKALHWIRWW